jgi:hypothetical protein
VRSDSLRPVYFAWCLAFAACGSEAPVRIGVTPSPSASPVEPDGRTSPASTVDAAAPIDAAGPSLDAGHDAALPPQPGLPFTYTRPPAGTPLSAAELAAATDKYTDLLAKTRYFDVLDERVHGWPADDPQGRYWYGTWWSGTSIVKTNGAVSYVHLDSGAENNGSRTAPILDGTCWATKLWGGAGLYENLTRRMLRGFNAWMLAMERQANDPVRPVLARSHYPLSISSQISGRDLFIDYSQSRPGKPGGGGGFIHIANNPSWGDIWVENVRSKDDIGDMLISIGALSDCSVAFADPGTSVDHKDMADRYAAWARKVEDDGWAIATFDENDQPYVPLGDLAHFYNVAGSECTSLLALRSFGRQSAGSIACGNGVNGLEQVVNSDSIVQSYHVAAVIHTLLSKQNSVAQALLTGLASRVENGVTAWEAGQPAMSEERLAHLISLAAAVGVPLTWREVRFVHAMIDKAYDTYVTQRQAWEYRLFDPSVADGGYPFEPPGFGFRWPVFAVPLGSCVAQFRNPTSNPIFDCARLKAWAP